MPSWQLFSCPHTRYLGFFLVSFFFFIFKFLSNFFNNHTSFSPNFTHSFFWVKALNFSNCLLDFSPLILTLNLNWCSHQHPSHSLNVRLSLNFLQYISWATARNLSILQSLRTWKTWRQIFCQIGIHFSPTISEALAPSWSLLRLAFTVIWAPIRIAHKNVLTHSKTSLYQISKSYQILPVN